MNMDIIFYDSKNIKEDFIFAWANCNIKPNIDDCVIIDDEVYKVIKVCIDYKTRTIHTFVEKIKNKKKKFWQ